MVFPIYQIQLCSISLSGATCPIAGWNCYCGWKYAMKNDGHGYETSGRGAGRVLQLPALGDGFNYFSFLLLSCANSAGCLDGEGKKTFFFNFHPQPWGNDPI